MYAGVCVECRLRVRLRKRFSYRFDQVRDMIPSLSLGSLQSLKRSLCGLELNVHMSDTLYHLPVYEESNAGVVLEYQNPNYHGFIMSLLLETPLAVPSAHGVCKEP